MLKTFVMAGSLAWVLSLTSLGRAQALPTATAHGYLQVGAGYTIGKPDYGQKNIEGITGFADYDFAPHIGIEADIHYVALNTPEDLAEDTYVIGPRILYRRGRFTPYVKVVAGLGSLVIQETQDNPGKYSGNYFAYGLGGGLDIQATHHIVIRAIDFEYQKWPGLGNGLSPTVITFGAAYRFR